MQVPSRRRSLVISTRSAEASATSRSLRAHGDADGARLQRQRIVDAVADHHRPIAGGDLVEHVVIFCAGRASARTRQCPTTPRCGARRWQRSPVSSIWRCSPSSPQIGDGLARLRPRLVGEQHPAEKFVAARDARDRAVMRGGAEIAMPSSRNSSARPSAIASPPSAADHAEALRLLASPRAAAAHAPAGGRPSARLTG